MAVEYIKGKDLNFFIPINGYNYPICRAEDCQIEGSRDTIETTTKNGLSGKTFNYSGKYQFTLTNSGVTNTMDTANIFLIMSYLMTATKISFIFTDGANVTISGSVLVPSVSFDSPSNGISRFNNSLLVDGELSVVTNGITPPPAGASVNIIDQTGTIIANAPAPGSYSVLKFDTLDLSGWNNPDLIITSQQALPS